MRTAVGKVFRLIATTMFNAYDMVDFKRQKGVVFVHSAIFAAKICTFCDK